jgi:peptidoglycan/LPS O-acetylase OafA/YrhL
MHYSAVFESKTPIMPTYSPPQVARQAREFARPGLQIPKYIPQFDGLRGIAILAVLFAHLTYLHSVGSAHLFQYGRTGVDLFFVLSGFLITGILLDTKDSPGCFKNFYARRALRIWPLYYGILFLFFFLLPVLFPRYLIYTDRNTWPYYVTYTQNLFYHFDHSAPLTPSWSLAVEEQYYMFWAPVVFLFGRRSLRNILFGMIVFSFCFRVISSLRGAPLEFLHNFTLCRLEPLAAGGLAALWLRSEKCTPVKWARGGMMALTIGLAGVAIALVDWGIDGPVYSYPFLAAAFAGVLALSLTANPATTFAGRVLTQRWLAYTGKISYGVYLMHVPIFMGVDAVTQKVWGKSQFSGAKQVPIVCVAFAATFLAASISWFCFERPILRLKEYFRSEKPTLENTGAK